MFSIEEIEQIMEDSAEAIAKQKEIDDILSGSYRFSGWRLWLLSSIVFSN
jgi:nucleotide-binding universal stress UspA family protein